jgi:hypothetical protein
MTRIYLTGSGQTIGYASGSGIISNPVRVLLQTKDNLPGAYPTIARTGDRDFSGVYQSTFDDTNTIVFDSTTIVYPTNVEPSSRFLSGGIASPSVLSGLTAPGKTGPGLSDSHISFSSEKNISPFDESRIYLDNDVDFYMTGTASGSIPGFSQKLGSKTIIVIDTNPASETKVGFSTGSATGASYSDGVNSGIAYYNFALRRWEVLGDLTTGSNIDYLRDSIPAITGSMLATVPAQYWASNLSSWDLNPLNASLGSPTDFAGFPYATKFNSTSSQMFSVSSSLTAPLLVEKIALTFSGVVGNYGYGSGEQPHVSTFLLMLERDIDIAGSSAHQIETIDFSGTPSVLNTTGSRFDYNRDRRIIWYGRIGRFSTAYYTDVEALKLAHPETYSACDLWIPSTTNQTGSFTVVGIPQIPSKIDRASPPYTTRTGDTNYPIFGRSKSGRSLLNEPDGRSFIGSSIGTRVVSSSLSYINTAAGNLPFLTYENDSYNSPFLLLPGDKIVLAHVNQIWVDDLPGTDVTEERAANWYRTLLSPGSGKITLFGSLLRNNLPVDSETNQFLTTPAVHESIQYDSQVYDQWDVEPISVMTGSYLDNVITGSLFVTNSLGQFGDPTVQGSRRVVASVASGQAGTTGSLQRFVRMSNESEQIYDSKIPEINAFLSAFGATAIDLSLNGAPFGTHILLLDATGDGTANNAKIDFVKSFPFAGLLSNIARSQSPRSLFDTPIKNARSLGQLSGIGFCFTGPSTGTNIIFGEDVASGLQTYENAIKSLFAFTKPGFSGSSIPVPPEGVINGGEPGDILIRGYKYGLAGLFGSSPDARFRRDKFGQFRDMLEQRQSTATLLNNSVDYPLKISFKLRDSLNGANVFASGTHSQNLDVYATSSVPYFDGVARERGDDPDNN